MAVYIVNNMTIHDRAAYEAYLRGFWPIFQRYGGEVLAVADAPTPVEGEWPFDRTVLLRFPSRADAERWAGSPEYRALAVHRREGTKSHVVILDAFTPPR
jgi:uncharacterized protein (DUF1330 family)